MQPRGACEIHEGFIKRQRLDLGGHLFHHGADGAGGFHIGVHAGGNDDGIGAELERLKHWHGRPHAANARDIAGCRDNATAASADNHGFGSKRWVVALFNGGIEGIAIHVGDAEIV